MSEQILRRLQVGASITAASTLGGALFGFATTAGNAAGAGRGAFVGAGIALILSVFELSYAGTDAGRWMRRLSFARLLAAKSVVYFSVFAVVLAVAPHVLPGGPAAPAAHGTSFATNIAFSAAFAVAINIVMQLNRLLGRGVLVNFVLGRYHRPREEERVFLFLDLVGSTSLAERLGGPRYMELLNQLYHDIAGPIVEHRGDIHKYVGDEVIITWRQERGLANAECVLCAFGIVDRMSALEDGYRDLFGLVPKFRIGLHAGKVVSGELGDLKQEIAFLGDTVNTTARLIDACRQYERGCIASADLVGRLSMPPGVAVEPLGQIQLRGRAAALGLFALSMPVPGS